MLTPEAVHVQLSVWRYCRIIYVNNMNSQRSVIQKPERKFSNIQQLLKPCNNLLLVGMQLPDKYKENVDVSSAGSLSGVSIKFNTPDERPSLETSKYSLLFSGSCIPTNESLLLLALPTLTQTVQNQVLAETVQNQVNCRLHDILQQAAFNMYYIVYPCVS